MQNSWWLAFLLVATLLSACLEPKGHFTFVVENTADDAVPEACEGGLKAKLLLSDVVIYEETVAEGESDTVDTRQTPNGFEPVGEGTPIIVEAWCYDATETEIGYVQKNSSINFGPGGLSATVIPFSSMLGDECLADTRRGKYPCIRSRVIR